MSSLSRLGSRGSQSCRVLAARRWRRRPSGPAKRPLLLEPLEQRTVLSADLGSTANTHLTVDSTEYDPSSILVRFRPGAAALDAGHILPGASNGRAFSSVPGLRVVKLGHGMGVNAALHAFQSNPNVLYAEPNFRVHTLIDPNDPNYPALYGMDKIDAPQAWDITTGDGSIVVGVIDTGVDYTHPDLADNMWTNAAEAAGDVGVDDDGNGFTDDVHGYNFVSYNGESIDDYFHGTHVAGTIGAVGNNGEGVVGVNWNVKIMSLKFLDAGGGGYTADAIAAVDYATMMRNLWVSSGGTEGANIRLTSNSWGGGGYDQGLVDAIDAGGAAGVLFVAAAGNDGSDADIYPMYPAAYDSVNIISVAATDSSDNIAYFSNWGLNSVDLGAPGVDIYSTFPTYMTDAMAYNGFSINYETISGTSMATPHVSGVAALAWSLNPSATVAEIRSAILGNVDPVAALATDGFTPVATGGRLNAHKTLQSIGMAVAGSTPAAGEIVDTQPIDFVVNFSHPYDPDTVDDGDLTVNGVSATSHTETDANTVTFHFGAPPAPLLIEGEWNMHIAAGALAADPSSGLPLDKLAVHEWNATFRYDALRMEVTSTDPADASAVQLPLSTLKVHLNEAVLPSSVQPSDLVLSQGSVVTAVLDSDDPTNQTILFGLGGIISEGTLYASIAAGAFTDALGNPNLAFTGSYSLDIGTIPFPTPLASVPPLGSLIHDPPFAGVLHDALDTDSFTINLDADQTITVVVHPIGAWQPTITLSGPLDGSSSPVAAGQDAVLQTVGPTTLGEYTVAVGSAGGFGPYTVEIILNAAVEMELHGGPANNSPATAQSVNASFIPLLKSATRGAVLGRTGASNPIVTVFSADFESGSPVFATTGLWHNSNGHRYEGGHSATQSMYFGAGEKYQQKGRQPETFVKGTYEVIKKGKGGGAQIAVGTSTSPPIVLPGYGQLTVDFNYLLQTDLKPGQDDAKLQILSAAGAVLKEVKYDDVAESSVWRAANSIDVSAYAGQTVQLQFSFNTVNALDNKFEGWYVDDVLIRQTIPHDNYSFTVPTDQRVTVVLQSAGDVNVLLQNAAGTATLASGAPGPVNASKMIYNYGPLSAGPAGTTYNLAITGQANTDYTMLVLLDAVFDSELNNSFDTAQSMDGVVGSLGYLGVEGRVGYFTDFNEFSTGPEAAIVQAGLTAVQITNISSFDLSTIDVLLVNESDNGGLSAALSGRLAAIQSWVEGGGVFMVHDRFVSNDAGDPQSNPFLLGQTGPGGIKVDRDFANGPDLDVIPPGSTLVTSGPHGTIDNTSLDGGNYSNHGFAVGASLPASATRILSAGPDSNKVAALSYPLGTGAVYYSTIPLDWYLPPYGQPGVNLATIYLPNALTYADTLNPAPASDWYSITAVGGADLDLVTTTPGGGAGEPANGLDPHIELYDHHGTLVAWGNAALRNETISYPVPAGEGGLYRVRITAQGGTTGEYFLDPIQTVPTPPPAPLLIASTAKTRKAGKGASAGPPVSAAASQIQATRRSSLDTQSVDALFASADQAGRKSGWYKAQPQTDVADALLDLVVGSVSRGKKGHARVRH